MAQEKNLHEMSFEQLGKLFPIIISEHDKDWKNKYAGEKIIIENAIGKENIVRINHYGSTFVPNLLAKPTIDILLEIKDDTDLNNLIENIKSIDYMYSPQPNNPAPHMMFMKGYTNKGFVGQAFHLHVRYKGDWDELYFRDYLLTNKDIAKEYGKLKLQLKEKFEHDREGYTQSKSEFIKAATKQARIELCNKYKIDKEY